MKMSKKVLASIQTALMQLEDGINFIQEENISIVRHTSIASLPETSWQSKIGQPGIAINKLIGSKLCQFYNARTTLCNLTRNANQKQSYEPHA